MANDMRPLNLVLRELKPLLEQKSNGVLFIVTDDNRFASIRLRDGKIDEVSFKNKFNDEATHLLAQVATARARFQPGIAPASKHGVIGDSAMRWLLGGYENMSSAPLPAKAPVSANGSANASASQRQRQHEIIEKVALNYFGPIASLLCEEAWVGGNDLEQALRQIAMNLSGRGEVDRFMAEARAALAK